MELTRDELITAVAEAHGTTYGVLRPILYAIERATYRGHNIGRYLSMLAELDILTPEDTHRLSEQYRTTTEPASTTATLYFMLRGKLEEKGY